MKSASSGLANPAGRAAADRATSTVHLARHPRRPQPSALKLFTAELSADPEVRARFQREANTVVRLDHPNILAVRDRGMAEGRLWIAMPYVDGGDAARLDPRALTVERAVRILAETAAALDFAHSRGITHRDVKPSHPGSRAATSDRCATARDGSPDGGGRAADIVHPKQRVFRPGREAPRGVGQLAAHRDSRLRLGSAPAGGCAGAECVHRLPRGIAAVGRCGRHASRRAPVRCPGRRDVERGRRHDGRFRARTESRRHRHHEHPALPERVHRNARKVRHHTESRLLGACSGRGHRGGRRAERVRGGADCRAHTAACRRCRRVGTVARRDRVGAGRVVRAGGRVASAGSVDRAGRARIGDAAVGGERAGDSHCDPGRCRRLRAVCANSAGAAGFSGAGLDVGRWPVRFSGDHAAGSGLADAAAARLAAALRERLLVSDGRCGHGARGDDRGARPGSSCLRPPGPPILGAQLTVGDC
ncbi:hypothetical protein D7D52_19975 [Nocardia yunnanensis]|uniref:non-specific serine/threonine protein kinase n=1 Tax=Nocardia yunnanensis TaxID=2382165 RepID=A0A386ZPY0_9NOCA|nr:hypothetical protein D7D52_19975 [Nocardia yunnanensis]